MKLNLIIQSIQEIVDKDIIIEEVLLIFNINKSRKQMELKRVTTAKNDVKPPLYDNKAYVMTP